MTRSSSPFFFSSRRRHTRYWRDWSSDVCSSDLGGCHTAKNVMGGDENSRALQGNTLQGWVAPNLTGDERTGLGRWSVDDVVEYLARSEERRVGKEYRSRSPAYNLEKIRNDAIVLSLFFFKQKTAYEVLA